MRQVIPGTGVLASIEYPANGLDWARLYDNRPSGCRVGDAGTIEPEPVIIGSLPLPAINTSTVLSPQWGFLATPARRSPACCSMRLSCCRRRCTSGAEASMNS